MPVEALLLPLRMPLFCSFEIIALVGCGIIHSAYLSLMRAYLKQADAAYIMVTKDKFLVNAPLLLCRLDASLTLVTDSEIDDRTLQRFAGYSIEVGPA